MTWSNSKYSNDRPDRLGDGWEVSDPRSAGLDPGILAAVVAKLERDEHPDFHSLLIARHGRLVLEAGFNGYAQDRLLDIRSAGKSFTSTLIGIAIDQGAIPDVQSTILPYFKQYEPHQNMDDLKELICIRDLLTMKSGLDADDNDASTPGSENNMLKSDDWIRYGLDLPMRDAPDQRWVYAGVNTMLLAGLLQSATGMPVLDFAKKHLFAPLGFNDFAWETAPNGIVVGQGFLSICGRDMLKLGQVFLDGGTWNGHRIVSETWVRAASKQRVNICDATHPGYGYQWWSGSFDLDTTSIECFFASGNGGNKIYVLPSLDMVISTASSAYNRPYMHTRSHEVLMQVIRSAI
jgi:CubicO group peptidase (beta-lactamase class C family)